jgi:hypothetical protein
MTPDLQTWQRSQEIALQGTQTSTITLANIPKRPSTHLRQYGDLGGGKDADLDGEKHVARQFLRLGSVSLASNTWGSSIPQAPWLQGCEEGVVVCEKYRGGLWFNGGMQILCSIFIACSFCAIHSSPVAPVQFNHSLQLLCNAFIPVNM